MEKRSTYSQIVVRKLTKLLIERVHQSMGREAEAKQNQLRR